MPFISLPNALGLNLPLVRLPCEQLITAVSSPVIGRLGLSLAKVYGTWFQRKIMQLLEILTSAGRPRACAVRVGLYACPRQWGQFERRAVAGNRSSPRLTSRHNPDTFKDKTAEIRATKTNN